VCALPLGHLGGDLVGRRLDELVDAVPCELAAVPPAVGAGVARC
jgi:hypothetical protein